MASSSSVFLPTLGVTLLLLSSNIKGVSATPSPLFSEILLPSPNVTNGAVGEIQCYALPYGAVGIISHLLTYWTIAWMAIGMTPIWPWHPMSKYNFDAFLAFVTLCTCIPIASITMQRCRLSWHFLLICIWKLVTSVSLACITLHRCYITRRATRQNNDPEVRVPLQTYQPYYGQGYPNQIYDQGRNPSFFQPPRSNNKPRDLTPLWWLILYLSGTIVGMVGLCSLLYTTFRKDRTIRNLTYGFGAAMAIIPILVAVYWYFRHLEIKEGGRRVCMSAFWKSIGGAVLAFTAAFGFFSSLYSDLVLGAIADNLFGLPSEDFAPLYWAWFIAKRLPMLSL